MAYTYDDFVNAAKAAGLYDGFGQSDLAIAQSNPEFGLSLLKLQQDLNGAKTAEQKVLGQEAINQLRTVYGQLPAATSDAGSEGKTPYQQALDRVTAQGSFSYDPAMDPAYASTKKTYLREGQRAMEDTLARAAGSTGGVASTAAVTAAQQANDYYNTQFNDIVPTLQQNAYQRYLNDFSDDVTRMEALKAEEQRQFENALMSYQALGYATPEVAAILGIEASGNSGGSGGGSGSVGGGYGGASGGGGNTGSGTGIPESMLSAMRGAYPNGSITNQTYWNSLVALYGADALAAAGFRFGGGNSGGGGGPQGELHVRN